MKTLLILIVIVICSCSPTLSKLQSKINAEDLSLLSSEQSKDRDVLNIMLKWEKTDKTQSWDDYYGSYYECDLCGKLVNKQCYCYKYR